MFHSSGKKSVISIIVAILVLSALSWFPSPDSKDIGRFFLNGVLCWFLFKGKNWARWIFVVLLVAAGVVGIFGIISGQNKIDKSIVLLAMSTTYLASAGLLVFSKSIASYFSASSKVNS